MYTTYMATETASLPHCFQLVPVAITERSIDHQHARSTTEIKAKQKTHHIHQMTITKLRYKDILYIRHYIFTCDIKQVDRKRCMVTVSESVKEKALQMNTLLKQWEPSTHWLTMCTTTV